MTDTRQPVLPRGGDSPAGRVPRWLLFALLASGAIWVGGRVAEPVRFGADPHAGLARATALAEGRVDRAYQDVTGELSAAAEAAARRPDLLRRVRDPGAVRALFALAARSAETLGDPTGLTALTIYDSAGEPVAWAGRPSDLPAIPARPPGFGLERGPLGVNLIRVAGVMDGPARLGTVVAERVLRTARGIRNRYLRDFDFTAAAAGLPVEVTYFTDEPGADARPSSTAVAATFEIRGPGGERFARVAVAPDALEPARQRLRGTADTVAAAFLLAALLALLLPLLSAPERPALGVQLRRLAAVVVLVWIARWAILWLNFPLNAGPLPSFSPTYYASTVAGPLLRSPADFALTACAVLATLLLVSTGFELVRRASRHRRFAVPPTVGGWTAYALMQIVTALVAVAVVISYNLFVADTVGNSTVDLLHFSFHPWSGPRLTLQLGVMAFHAAAALLLLNVFRLGLFVARRPGARLTWLPAHLSLWAAALALAHAIVPPRSISLPYWPSVVVFFAAALSGYYADRLIGRLRRRAASTRLAAVFVALVVPSLLFYASTTHYSERTKRRLIESQLAQQVLRQREDLLFALQQSLKEIDADNSLEKTLGGHGGGDLQNLAFRVWMRTDLASFRLTSAIEIYDEGGALVSRFALNLPEYSSPQRRFEADPGWQLAEETVPFGALTRHLMHGSRAIYDEGRRAGVVIVHILHDYNTLPFISSQNPYYELFRSSVPAAVEGTFAHDVELAVYDWQRNSAYSSSRAPWELDQAVLARIRRVAAPFWTTFAREGARDHVLVFWDSGAIYVLGYPRRGVTAHVIEVAELVTLVGTTYVTALLLLGLYGWMSGRRGLSPSRLPSEVRTSFYRKLFLAFVAASVAPVIVLSLVIRAEFAARLRADVEHEAQKTVAVAKRVVQDVEFYSQRGAEGRLVNDDVMVWIGSVIDQDVNVFVGGRVLATSERDLFASGLLPTRAPAALYEAIVLDRAANYVGYETIGSFRYMIAGAAARLQGQEAILTVPLTLRQQEIEREIDELDRELQLATLLFVLAAAAVGYSVAERIADPIGRLTRATRRVAKGDFETRLVATSSDEIQGLMSAFNRMAADLKVQRERLERTNRLEAWAEMARQVAHDIKNPLTPIQLSAEHLRRVQADSGGAPRAVLDRCVDTILRQVRLLRQIASEFSSFATTPEPEPEPFDATGLLEDVVTPYRAGLDGRIELAVACSPDVPRIFADRVLVSRALTNLVENAVHAIPDRGRIVLSAAPAGDHRVAIEVTDTGRGMEPELLRQIFEPYFSTRSSGTGLGMTIAKRNIEASGGTIEVTSERGQGTRVRVVLPAANDY